MPANLKGGYRSKNGMVTYGKVKKYKPGGENKAGLTKLVKMAKDKYGITAKKGREYPGGGSYMGPGMSMNRNTPERKEKRNMAFGGGMGPMKPGEKEKKVMGYGGSHMGMKNMDPRMEAAKFRKRK